MTKVSSLLLGFTLITSVANAEAVESTIQSDANMPLTVTTHYQSNSQVSLEHLKESGTPVLVSGDIEAITIPSTFNGRSYDLEYKQGIQVSLMPDATCGIKHFLVVFEPSLPSTDSSKSVGSKMQPVQYISSIDDGCSVSISEDGKLANVTVDFKAKKLKTDV